MQHRTSFHLKLQQIQTFNFQFIISIATCNQTKLVYQRNWIRKLSSDVANQWSTIISWVYSSESTARHLFLTKHPNLDSFWMLRFLRQLSQLSFFLSFFLSLFFFLFFRFVLVFYSFELSIYLYFFSRSLVRFFSSSFSHLINNSFIIIVFSFFLFY